MKPQTAKTEKPAGPGAVDVDITQAELDEAVKAVAVRVRQAILGIKHQADPGRVSGLGADLRFLMHGVNATREPQVVEKAPEVDPVTAKRRAAASDDALMQEQNRETVKRERAEIAREEGIKE